MPLEILGYKISQVGIIGSGHIGPDIALHFAQTMQRYDVKVIVVDVDQRALVAGEAKVKQKLQKSVSKGKLKQDQADALADSLRFVLDGDDDDSAIKALAHCGLIIEAVTEDLQVKREIFSRLEEHCSARTIITSNSSHLEPDQLFAQLKERSRCLVLHYFFPAERNPLVEVVPGSDTDQKITGFLLALCELLGKFPVLVKPRYGYAVNPVFSGLFLAGALAVQRGLGTCAQVDAVCQKKLGQGVGPFTAMNLCGGTPLAAIGLAELHDKVASFFHVPKLLDAQVQKGEQWPVAARGEAVDVDAPTEKALTDWMLGAYFALACEVLDAGLIDVSDYDEALALGLAMNPPFSMMNELGLQKSLALVQSFALANLQLKVSARLRSQAKSGKPWPLQYVLREDRKGIAVLCIRRFKVLNALNRQVMEELSAHADALAKDKKVKGVVIRGFGNRAFVAGADIRQLSQLPSPRAAAAFALHGQAIVRKFETMKKPVIAAMNGLALGGGNELAMACHARLATAGQKLFVGQPEPKLGIIPGYGGTQRLPRWVGFEAAWPMLRTAEPISSAQAKEIGLIRDEVPAEGLLEAAIALARDAATKRIELPPIPEEPIAIPDPLPAVEIGSLSPVIDEILVRATVQGAKTTLKQGLASEAQAFAECRETEDFQLGMKNFLENGPRKAAPFKGA